MKTKLFLVALFGLFTLTGCSNDDDNNENLLYNPDAKETITKELENVPAYVLDYNQDCVMICYSKYADDFFDKYYEDDATPSYTFKWSSKDTLERNLYECSLGVSKKDFSKYKIKIRSKVYVTASVTNNNSGYIKPNAAGQIPLTEIVTVYHAYLHDIKLRN